MLVSFDEWTSNRAVVSIGTNAGAEVLPFQTWHHFKEAFAPELVSRAVAGSAIPVAGCLDPFGGSGTTALACQFLGVLPTTVEVNPFLADLAQAKLTPYDPDQLVGDISFVARSACRFQDAAHDLLRALPPTFVEPGVKGRWLFGRPVAERILALSAAIGRLPSPATRRLLRVLLGGVLVGLSNAVVNGKGRRYRRGWEAKRRHPDEVTAAFFDAAYRATREINQHQPRRVMEGTVICGDARTALRSVPRCELAVLSPPYPNSFDYTDIYNIQLWMLGYFRSMEDNRALRLSTLCSHVQILREYAPPPNESRKLAATVARLAQVRSELWSPWIPEMVAGYFADMASVLDGLACALAPGGSAWIVVGDSRYADVRVDTAGILADLSRQRGFVIRLVEPFRSMRASAQQGGREELAETLLVLDRAGTATRASMPRRGPRGQAGANRASRHASAEL